MSIGPNCFEPSSDSSALRRGICRLTFESNVTFRHSPAADERSAKLVLASGRIIHCQTAPFVELYESALLKKRGFRRATFRQQFVHSAGSGASRQTHQCQWLSAKPRDVKPVGRVLAQCFEVGKDLRLNHLKSGGSIYAAANAAPMNPASLPSSAESSGISR